MRWDVTDEKIDLQAHAELVEYVSPSGEWAAVCVQWDGRQEQQPGGT